MTDNETRVYLFMDRRSGKEVTVGITVDWDELAKQLGFRALQAKGGKSVSLQGAVEGKVVGK